MSPLSTLTELSETDALEYYQLLITSRYKLDVVFYDYRLSKGDLARYAVHSDCLIIISLSDSSELASELSRLTAEIRKKGDLSELRIFLQCDVGGSFGDMGLPCEINNIAGISNMKLLPFQQDAADRCLEFAKLAHENKKKLESNSMPLNSIGAMAWGQISPGTAYSELTTRGGVAVPNASICIPTGGGKTVTGIHTAIRLVEFYDEPSSFIVWLVPSDAIYRQVIRDFSTGGPYFKSVLSEFGKPINLKTNTSVWTDGDLDSNSAVTILLLSKDALIRSETRRSALLLYRNPDKVSSLTLLHNSTNPCLYELIKVTRPVFVIDESHKTYTEIGRDFFRSEAIATFILELTATPKPYDDQTFPNIIYTASGTELVEHQLIKNPISYTATVGLDPETLLKSVLDYQASLQEKFLSINYPVVPRVLISTEFTGRARESETYSVFSIKKILQDLGVHEDEIIIKSSELDELGDRDLDDFSDPAKYILTKTALMEGWDCKSVYILVLLNRVSAPITNFQILGRGLRQPARTYFSDISLNTLFVLTNSERHEESVNTLVSFLAENGLSELNLRSGRPDNSTVLHNLTLEQDPHIHYLNFDYDVYDSLTFRRDIQSEILASRDKIFEQCKSQDDAELRRANINLQSGASGAPQYQTLNVDSDDFC